MTEALEIIDTGSNLQIESEFMNVDLNEFFIGSGIQKNVHLGTKPTAGCEGDQVASGVSLSESSSCSDEFKTQIRGAKSSTDSVASDAGSRRSMIPKRSLEKRRGRSVSQVGAGEKLPTRGYLSHRDTESVDTTDDLAVQVNKVWHEGILNGSEKLSDSPYSILKRLAGTEGLILEQLTPVLDQIRENEDRLKKTGNLLKARDNEIASLKKIEKELRDEIDALNKQLGNDADKRSANFLNVTQEMDQLRKHNSRVANCNKQLIKKEKELNKMIMDLQDQLKDAVGKERTNSRKLEETMKRLTEAESKYNAHVFVPVKNMTDKLQNELNDALMKWGASEKELDKYRQLSDKNENFEKKTRQKYQEKYRLAKKELNKQEAEVRAKIKDLSLWEHELTLREDCLERNNSLIAMRERLLEMLDARESRREQFTDMNFEAIYDLFVEQTEKVQKLERERQNLQELNEF